MVGIFLVDMADNVFDLMVYNFVYLRVKDLLMSGHWPVTDGVSRQRPGRLCGLYQVLPSCQSIGYFSPSRFKSLQKHKFVKE